MRDLVRSGLYPAITAPCKGARSRFTPARRLFWTATLMFAPFATPEALAAGESHLLDLTATSYGLAALAIFVLAYLLVMGEEFLHLRKSKPVMVAAGIIWILIALAYAAHGDTRTAGQAVRHNILEYGELFLFLLAAMTYINTLEERQVFNALRAWLVSRGLSLRAVYWSTGLLTFFISPVADNLTTSLVMGAVVMSVAAGNRPFISLACVNVVVAANAGGAFSPFGDITTLMVWQKGVVPFSQFFALFVPSLVNWLVPAALMSFALPRGKPAQAENRVAIQHGGLVILGLFLSTIAMAVAFYNFLHLPPVLGMMTGLGLLKFYGYYLRRVDVLEPAGVGTRIEPGNTAAPRSRFDIFQGMQRAEWDTLMFFYGVVLCVGGLGTLGYLALLSETFYGHMGPTAANVLVGLISAIVDNIPVMFAVLSMMPDMSVGQWLLVTLTAGVGGSLLSIGSAAGVALMGQARGMYTFFTHLRWSWAIALGYAASIYVHTLLNASAMHSPLAP
jgi:Na+/H+ antiporter NhaD/arsenite permease-like protein